ncbi:uncharacterized protein VDAG_06309 [Verticillium dahliae VdLs.17]|uniref:Uncharacterized protein n=1 Tax=Verticillium dahliae (strain VdLs.17 / ATCC MYA-4575 / FGSC 10137) TaxID=498257 RepID=G2X751_VERDV|nr:uncharacterized protein VDAG_06309 [Verticillium dahliae VdLs.17]EGY14819.1 hypothetical protein VDAG_06309 [Verticillium dahliae VdLs.17]
MEKPGTCMVWRLGGLGESAAASTVDHWRVQLPTTNLPSIQDRMIEGHPPSEALPEMDPSFSVPAATGTLLDTSTGSAGPHSLLMGPEPSVSSKQNCIVKARKKSHAPSPSFELESLLPATHHAGREDWTVVDGRWACHSSVHPPVCSR